MGWSVVADELGEFIEILSPQKRVSEEWYQGTADAVYQNLHRSFARTRKQLIVLSGDHVYKMDYAKMLRTHGSAALGATLAVIEVPSEEASRFGVLQVGEGNRITGFLEKAAPRRGDQVLASMGIYIFDMSVLVPALGHAQAGYVARLRQGHHPGLISQVPVYAYRSTTRTRRRRNTGATSERWMRTTKANMDLCHVNPEFNLYDPEWLLRTHQLQAPPAKFVFADEGRRCGQRSTRSSRPAASFRGAASRRACSVRTSACTASATSIRRS